MKEKLEAKVPNVSGSFQIINNERKKELKEIESEDQLDDESIYYARIFMED